MTQSQPNLDDVRRRRKEIELKVKALNEEDRRLLTAEQVLMELAGHLRALSPNPDAASGSDTPRIMVNGSGETVVSLIEMVLHSGKRWWVAQEIQKEVSRLKGSEVPVASISQTLHYMKGKGRLVRSGLRVRAPQEKGSALAEPNPESGGHAGPSDHVAG